MLLGDIEIRDPVGYGHMRTLTRNVNNEHAGNTYYLEISHDLYLPFLSVTKKFEPRLITIFN